MKIAAERVEMYHLSAAMGFRWAEICEEFTGRIRELGPSPVRLALEKKAAGIHPQPEKESGK